LKWVEPFQLIETGDTKREATTTEVHDLKNENIELKQLVAELSLELRKSKKNTIGSE